MITPQQILWQRFGTNAHPSEWDGRDGNGGKGSQRFWEYLWTLGHLQPKQWVLDVGGGAGFFYHLLRDSGFTCTVVDPEADESMGWRIPVEEMVRNYRDALMAGYSFLTCISVLEHVADRPAFCAALDQFNTPIALTFEFGPSGVEQKEMYACLREFKRHHLVKMERCPVHADNSGWNNWVPMGIVLMPNL